MAARAKPGTRKFTQDAPLDSASILSDYAVEFRYPTDDPDPTIQEARQALAIAREVFDFILDRLPAETHP